MSVHVHVCRQCRGVDRSTGSSLVDALRATDIGHAVHDTDCLGACSRGCVVALTGWQRKTWVFGELRPVHALDVRDVVRRYATSSDGSLPDRPPALRRIVLRLPVV
ncbi:MAG: DUF1636 domain-containing protein [Deltaproteobacteria bacterium]|nr:DUF1636 domain-containing protein [Deltaproteobacteria bacterium]